MEEFDKKLTTKEKALQLNLDTRIYGTVAEIGGGQEVAAYFFKAGAASGTIAKTMSAYDMTFSDAIYGKCDRYVSQEKLLRMLDREYSLLDQRLTQRAKKSNFFAFANTVETINYNRSNVGHGWLGIRFQKHAMTKPNECIIHVTLKDRDAEWQQQVLGIVGVNLIHSCYTFNTPEEIIDSLVDNVRKDRLEIDMFSISGPDFHHVDNRLMTLKLVKNGLTKVAMFGPDKNVILPSDIIYRKNAIVLRGRFRPVTHVNVDMMITGMRAFKKELGHAKDIVSVVEITLKDLTLAGELDEQDYLDRVDLLCSLGQNVMISNYQEHYKLAGYLSQFIKDKTLGIIIGLNNLSQIFDEKYYKSLDGGILESFARLFGSNVKLFVYPIIDSKSGEIRTGNDFEPERHLQSLFYYFIENQKILSIPDAKTDNLHIISDQVLEMIQNDEDGWEDHVPNRVAESIKANHLFNYPYEIEVDEEDMM
ncbi:TonB-dependent receptor [Ekhidna sp.]|uniref:TonB-dependent receptor n=1 Tax=Ekhidna sp. TaxID=2608089 RepID=UPI003CCBF0E6